ncbi:MAG: tRNA adenosine(34) deaminase TadA [Acidimicrobiales bacterium]
MSDKKGSLTGSALDPLGEDARNAMRAALSEARRAPAHADTPVGAVALLGGKVLAARHNERELRQDPTAHAEVLALTDAARLVGRWRLEQVTLVVTLEPCAMCAGAMVNSRLDRLIFGAWDPKAGAAGSLYNLLTDPRLNHEVHTTGGVLADECGELISSFFRNLRSPPDNDSAPTTADD